MDRLEALERLVVQTNTILQDMNRRLASIESRVQEALHAGH